VAPASSVPSSSTPSSPGRGLEAGHHRHRRPARTVVLVLLVARNGGAEHLPARLPADVQLVRRLERARAVRPLRGALRCLRLSSWRTARRLRSAFTHRAATGYFAPTATASATSQRMADLPVQIKIGPGSAMSSRTATSPSGAHATASRPSPSSSGDPTA
jgi:hypothetical protein